MSSSTSSSNAHRTYVLGVLLLAFVPAAAFFATGLYLQPLDGDLTRIGAHAEREYGWNSPQTVFQQPLYTIGAYTEPHDMVVVGDSFATAMPAHQWQNHLVATTGLSLATLGGTFRTVEEGTRREVEKIFQRGTLFTRLHPFEFRQEFRVVTGADELLEFGFTLVGDAGECVGDGVGIRGDEVDRPVMQDLVGRHFGNRPPP